MIIYNYIYIYYYNFIAYLVVSVQREKKMINFYVFSYIYIGVSKIGKKHLQINQETIKNRGHSVFAKPARKKREEIFGGRMREKQKHRDFVVAC